MSCWVGEMRFYSHNWSFWDPFYEEERRFVEKQFLRRVGSNVTISMMINEFETREGAEREFEELFERFNISNPLGLAERTTNVPEGGSFTYVDYESYTRLRTFQFTL
ncbi:MAG: hypothetical protein DRO05_01240 [Thermoproteota archaeon]|nr:MAG: hypothetical protein DRO05_01240 [Candidatus Korarchaeota archaeon]